MATMKVKPWGDDQGDYVIIEEENFDKDFHEVYEEKKKPAPKPKVKGE